MSPNTSSTEKRPIIVLGAGIVGLTTAIRLLKSPLHKHRGHAIHLVADHWPEDGLNARYASTAAGAHHLSFAADNDERQRRWDRKTFEIMFEEVNRLGEDSGLMKIKQTEYYDGEEKHLQILEQHPDFVIHDPANLPSFATHSVSFTSLTMTPQIYLNRLIKQFDTLTSSTNGEYRHKAHLKDLAEIASLIPGVTPLAVVVCVGIGALYTPGILDTTVFPTRGQVVLVNAPWIKEGYTRQIGSLNGAEGGERTYVIPRSTGQVVLGGTREINDWTTTAREETSESILKRAVEICPDLLGGQDYEQGMKTLREKIVKEVVGYRPSRIDGVRLEKGDDISIGKEKVEVVHNYGHGGAGWQSCWGCAEDVVKVLTEGIVA